MEVPRDSLLLRIFIGESDRFEHKPLYEAIVLKARELHLGGATVLRGPMGFGKSSRMHTAKILRLSMDLPMVIEIVDSEDKINAFLPALEGMMSGGMITLERVQVIEYRHVERKELGFRTSLGDRNLGSRLGSARVSRCNASLARTDGVFGIADLLVRIVSAERRNRHARRVCYPKDTQRTALSFQHNHRHRVMIGVAQSDPTGFHVAALG